MLNHYYNKKKIFCFLDVTQERITLDSLNIH